MNAGRTLTHNLARVFLRSFDRRIWFLTIGPVTIMLDRGRFR